MTARIWHVRNSAIFNQCLAIYVIRIFIEVNAVYTEWTWSNSSKSVVKLYSDIWLEGSRFKRNFLYAFMQWLIAALLVSLLLSSSDAQLATAKWKAILSLGLQMFLFFLFYFRFSNVWNNWFLFFLFRTGKFINLRILFL